MRLADHMSRYAEIGAVLAKHGWRAALSYVGLERLRKRRELSLERAQELLPAAGVRRILTDLGPTYVKVGQILSTRPDLVPEPYVRELEKLQDHAGPIPFATVTQVLEESLGGPPDGIFEALEEEPMAAASIGQVHAARYHGRNVAVKVRRPGIAQKMDTDLDIIIGLARRLEATWPAARRHRIASIVRELADFVRAELDFVIEGRNADRLRHSLRSFPHARIPVVEWDLTSSRVLVTERLEGAKITDEAGLERIAADRATIARRLGETMIRQIFLNGLFHGDPHPGNLMVCPDGTIGFLDFGNVVSLDAHTRSLLLDMLLALQRRDPLEFSEALLGLTLGGEAHDRGAFVRDVNALLRAYSASPPGQGRIGRVLRNAMNLVWRNGLSVGGEIGVLVKACVQFEGVCRRLDPEFDVLDLVDGLVVTGAVSRLRDRDTAIAGVSAASDLLDLALFAPRAVSRILTKAAHGQMTARVEHRGAEEFTERLDKMANRLAYGLVVSASIIGSALLVQTDIGPKLGDFPVLGVGAFGVSAFLAGVLLWNILTSGRLK